MENCLAYADVWKVQIQFCYDGDFETCWVRSFPDLKRFHEWLGDKRQSNVVVKQLLLRYHYERYFEDRGLPIPKGAERPEIVLNTLILRPSTAP